MCLASKAMQLYGKVLWWKGFKGALYYKLTARFQRSYGIVR